MSELTIEQTFQIALQHHQAGQLPQAEKLYRDILAKQPGHVNALHYLGVIAHQVGRNDIAVDLIRRVLTLQPGNAEAHNNLGTALNKLGNVDQAIAAYRRAVALKPDYSEAYSNLGNALRDARQLEEAIASFRRAIALSPIFAPAFNNLGLALKEKGQLAEALAAYRQALALKPNYVEAYSNLGNALKDGNQLNEAVAAYRQAIALGPSFAEGYSNLGAALRDMGQFEEAIAAFRRAVVLNPNFAQAFNNLGVALNETGQREEAIGAFRRALALNHDYPEAHSNLGNVLWPAGRPDEAVAACRQALALKPQFPEAYVNLGNALKDKGQLNEAIAAFRQAMALKPDFSDAHSSLIFHLHAHPDYNAVAIAEELRSWGRQHAQPLRKLIQPHSNDRNPQRPLRVGYVSPDLRENVVGQNILSLLAHHDRRQFHITCYAQVARPDAITRRIQAHVDCWRNTLGVGDEEVARQIREDRIDILVDLSLHTANNRLLVFARKPAPVQVTYLAYCSSSGIGAMDYRLSDPHFDPPETDLSCYSEKTVRLPQTYWCYRPAGPTDEPSQSPALSTGFVTFGCLNNFYKVNSTVLDLWARVLQAAPDSRLMIHTLPGTHVEETTQRFGDAGIARSRLTFVGRQPWAQYTKSYSQIDIALDPFPYCGGITTCDALWMGVPVVTLSGKTAVGRGGRSILSNLGLTELIALAPDQYVDIAIELSKDLRWLNELRQGMRGRMLASPLMDAERFARDVEAAYREIWHNWCKN